MSRTVQNSTKDSFTIPTGKNISSETNSIVRSDLLWPEWSDSAVNTEKWEIAGKKPKITKPIKPVKKSKSSDTTTATATASLSTANVNSSSGSDYFVDVCPLPPSLQASSWQRPEEFFHETKFTIETPNQNDYPNLTKKSKHILHSDFMRDVISAYNLLEYLGSSHAKPFAIEYLTSSFSASTNGLPWRPWHHIYSGFKVGKGLPHRPVVNLSGKYVVRLFWMGCWRKLLVNDSLPLDDQSRILLPCMETVDKTFILWPIILTKALLKVASLTWTDKKELVDFDPVVCLTGWTAQRLRAKGLLEEDLWSVCAAYTDHYNWAEDRTVPEKEITKKSSRRGPKKVERNDSKMFPDEASKQSVQTLTKSSKIKGKKKGSSSSKKSSSQKTDKISPKASKVKDGDFNADSYYMFAKCSDMSSESEELVPDLTPCLSHPFLIDQTRDIPLIKPSPRPELARWKLFRWVAWAIRQGIWEQEDPFTPIKCLKLVSFFRKVSKTVELDKTLSQESKDMGESARVIDEVVNGVASKKRSRKKDSSSSASGESKKSKKSSKKSVKSNKSIKSKSSKKPEKSKSSDSSGSQKLHERIQLPDPSIWQDFSRLVQKLDYVIIYFKPTAFSTNIRVSDQSFLDSLAKLPKKVSSIKEKKDIKTDYGGKCKSIQWPNTLLKSRNEPLCVFTDSLDFKFSLISLSKGVCKDVGLEEQPKSDLNESIVQQSSLKEIDAQSDPQNQADSDKILEPKPNSQIDVVIESYSWQANEFNPAIIVLKTTGNQSVLIDFNPGRLILRFWINSCEPYVLGIMSDTEMVAGTFEDVLENMKQESIRVLQFSHDFCSKFCQVINDYQKTDYIKSLREFYQMYIPTEPISKIERSLIDECFFGELIRLISCVCSEADLANCLLALRKIFLMPEFTETPAPPVELSSYNETDMESVESQKTKELAAVKIQAFFKMVYVRNLIVSTFEANKRYADCFESLRSVFFKLFNMQNRFWATPSLLRKFLFRREMVETSKKYSILSDILNVIYLQTFDGSVKAEPDSWVPILRYKLNVLSEKPISIKVMLSCNLPMYALQVFNNDTRTEMPRYINNTITTEYVKNREGYTILCHGRNQAKEQLNANWRLNVISTKIELQPLVEVKPVVMEQISLSHTYIPNPRNLVFRCFIKVKTSACITLRIMLSYEKAGLYVQCLTPQNEVLHRAKGWQKVIIPLLHLEHFSDSLLSALGASSELGATKAHKRKPRASSVSMSSSSTSKRKSKSIDMNSSDRRSVNRSSTSNALKKEKPKKDSIASLGNDTVYILEAYVVQDTWPLSNAEWEVVQQAREANYIRKELENPGPNAATDPARKLSDSRKERRVSRTSNSLLQPYWMMTCFYEAKDAVVVQRDTSKEEELKKAKRQWNASESGRMARGSDLRNKFLTDNYISFDSPYAEQVQSGSIKPPEAVNGSSKSKIKTGSLNGAEGSLLREANVLEQFDSLDASPKNVLQENRIRKSITEQAKSLSCTSLRSLKSPMVKRRILKSDSLDKFFNTDYLDWPEVPSEIEKELGEIEINSCSTSTGSFSKPIQTDLRRCEILQKWYSGVREESSKRMKEAQDMHKNLRSPRPTSSDKSSKSSKVMKKPLRKKSKQKM